MQLSILPVKEYNVSNDAKEKEVASSSSFLALLQENQTNSEKKKDAELTNLLAQAATIIAQPMKMEQLSKEAVTTSTENEFNLHPPLQNQAVMNGVNIKLDPLQNVVQQSPLMIAKGKMIENKLGNPLLEEKSLGLNLQNQAVKPIVDAGGILQAKTVFEQEIPKIIMDHVSNGLSIKLDPLQNVMQQSPLMIAKGKMHENKLGNPLPVEESVGLKLQSQAVIPISDEMLQQAANITSRQVSQKVPMDPMPNQAMGINVQDRGIVNLLVSNDGSASKLQTEPRMVNLESLLNNQFSLKDSVANSSPLLMGKVVPKMKYEFHNVIHVNNENQLVELTPLHVVGDDVTNKLETILHSGNEPQSKENKDITNDSNPIQDKMDPSNNSATNTSILTINSQGMKSFYSNAASSVPTTVSKLAQDIVSTFSPHIHVSGSPEKMEATLSLNPEHLGAVDVKVVIQDGHVSARLIADSFIGRTTLEQHVDSLYAALQQQGLQVDKINITQQPSSSLPSAFSQGGDSAPKQGQQQSRRRGDSYGETEEYSDAPYESEWVSQINTMA